MMMPICIKKLHTLIVDHHRSQTFGVYAENTGRIKWFTLDVSQLNILQSYFGQSLSNVTSDILTW